MARKVKNYTVTDEGRDQGKVFIITEMPASKAESWATRALFALMANDVDIPPGFEDMGMAAMAEMGFQALKGLKWEVAEPLLDDMWGCIQIMPDSSKPNLVRNLIEEDIEDVMTRVKLRGEVWEVHTGFSIADALLKSKAKKEAEELAAAENLDSTEMSHQ